MDDTGNKLIDPAVISTLQHDIRNQLSNIILAIEGLKHEVAELEGDYDLYLDSLAQSARKIDQLLNSI